MNVKSIKKFNNKKNKKKIVENKLILKGKKFIIKLILLVSKIKTIIGKFTKFSGIILFFLKKHF